MSESESHIMGDYSVPLWCFFFQSSMVRISLYKILRQKNGNIVTKQLLPNIGHVKTPAKLQKSQTKRIMFFIISDISGSFPKHYYQFGIEALSRSSFSLWKADKASCISKDLCIHFAFIRVRTQTIRFIMWSSLSVFKTNCYQMICYFYISMNKKIHR